MFPLTYESLPSLSTPYGTGTVWAAALWDLTWAMVARYGASHDLLEGRGAENRMLRLVIEAIATMPCPAGFVTSRDSLLAADQRLHGGQDRCRIWQAFARRGIGLSASQGQATSTTDQVAASNVPFDCVEVFGNGFE